MSEQLSARPVSYVGAPINVLLAALMCASTEEQRHYLNGVHLHRAGETVRVVSTDGLAVFVANVSAGDAGDQLPEWLTQGLTLPRHGLKEQLSLIRKLGDFETVRIGFGTDQPELVIESPDGSMSFRTQPVDGSFPDYELVMAHANCGLDPEREPEAFQDFEAVGYGGTQLKRLADIASALQKGGSVSVFAKSRREDAPVLITFPMSPNVIMYQMPMKSGLMPEQTAALLERPIKASIAALQAHETRNRKAAVKCTNARERNDLVAKADGFAKRIKALLERVTPALPKPAEPVHEAEVVPIRPDVKITDAIAPAAPPKRRAKVTPKAKPVRKVAKVARIPAGAKHEHRPTA